MHTTTDRDAEHSLGALCQGGGLRGTRPSPCSWPWVCRLPSLLAPNVFPTESRLPHSTPRALLPGPGHSSWARSPHGTLGEPAATSALLPPPCSVWQHRGTERQKPPTATVLMACRTHRSLPTGGQRGQGAHTKPRHGTPQALRPERALLGDHPPCRSQGQGQQQAGCCRAGGGRKGRVRGLDSDSQNLSFLLRLPPHHGGRHAEVGERDRCLQVPHLPAHMPTTDHDEVDEVPPDPPPRVTLDKLRLALPEPCFLPHLSPEG